MPLVISHKSKRKYFVPSEEVLAEILGHSNFDGEDWAVGDRIVFEDGTEAEIIQEPGEQFHVWSDPQRADLERILSEINRYHSVQPLRIDQIPGWDALFAHLKTEQPTKSGGCASMLLILTILAVAVTQATANKRVEINLRPAAELTIDGSSDTAIPIHPRSWSQVTHPRRSAKIHRHSICEAPSQ